MNLTSLGTCMTCGGDSVVVSDESSSMVAGSSGSFEASCGEEVGLVVLVVFFLFFVTDFCQAEGLLFSASDMVVSFKAVVTALKNLRVTGSISDLCSLCEPFLLFLGELVLCPVE